MARTKARASRNSDTLAENPRERRTWRTMIQQRRILMPLGDATEALDTFYPFFRLPEDGFDVVVAGPEARLYHSVLHEMPPNPDVPWDITQERPGYHIQAQRAFRDLHPADYCGMFLSGGRARVPALRP